MIHRKEIVRFALSHGERDNYHEVLKKSYARFSSRGISYSTVNNTLKTVYELKGWRESLPSYIDVQMTRRERASSGRTPLTLYTHVRDRALMTGQRFNDLEGEVVRLKKMQNIIKKMGLPCSHDGTEKL